MDIRSADLIDVRKLNQFREAEWPEVDERHFDNKELVDFDEQELTFVAQDNEEICGYIKMRTEMSVCFIESLIVGKNFRNQGIAKSLVKKVEETCKEMNLHKISLETGVEWEARKLYEKLGYKTICELKDHYGHKDFVLMEKNLEV